MARAPFSCLLPAEGMISRLRTRGPFLLFVGGLLPKGVVPLVRERSSFLHRQKGTKNRLRNLRFLRISLRSIGSALLNLGAMLSTIGALAPRFALGWWAALASAF